MRLNRFHIVAATLACLLISGSAQAQFGKLKSLAKDKLGMQSKDDSQNKGTASEAKATSAPGGKKSLDVSRKADPSPEANSKVGIRRK